MQHHHTKVALVSLVLCLAAVGTANAVRPGGGGGGGKAAPDPDIIYLSDDGSTQALTQGAVRGIDLAEDGLSGRDLSLLKSKAGRQNQAVAWSPDGKLAAWYEIGLGMVSTPNSIMVAAPGAKPVAVYTSVPGDGQPQLTHGADALAWGPVCGGGTQSMLVFASHDPVGIYGIRFEGNQPGEPELLMSRAVGTGFWVYPSAFAFSPSGQYLAFAGSGGSTGAYGVWVLPVCAGTGTPDRLLTGAEIAGADLAPVTSIDWSRHGDRLAMSVVTGTDPAYDWRDLKIAYLDYLNDGVTEQVLGHNGIVTINLDPQFTSASSEHSPQWGPAAAGDECQRIAFSQSSDAGRRLYLLDIGPDGLLESCDIALPRPIGAKWPRALDWR
jgi:WD40 repeat protein